MSSYIVRIKELYQDLSDGAIERVLAVMADDIEWHVAEGNPFGDGGTLTSPAEVAQTVFAPVVEIVDGFKITPIAVHEVVGDGVLAEVRYSGTRKADGVSFDVQAAHLWQFRGGRAVRFQQYINSSAWAKATSAESTVSG